ncbi:MAG: hypothetical protein ACETWE_06000 [Candidatus Bathyarchaeia archaeon]
MAAQNARSLKHDMVAVEDVERVDSVHGDRRSC